MKKIIAAAALALTATSAIAEENTCKKIGKLAESIMDARQMEISVVDMLGTANGNKIIERIVMDAYDQIPYVTEERKRKQTLRFSNKWELVCVKSLKRG